VSAQFSCKFSLQEIAYLVKISEGDLRKAITFLQSATRLTGGKEVSEDVITDIAGASTVNPLGFYSPSS
jgi:DNA polymerase III delta prime subunit